MFLQKLGSQTGDLYHKKQNCEEAINLAEL